MVCKQFFDINNELKLNIYESDSLKVDYNNEFGIKHFDIIMGNSPYQKKVGPKKLKHYGINLLLNHLKY